jgi:hypothetical protein
MPTVQDTNYLNVVTTAVLADSTYDLTLKDNNGNVFPKTTIEINTTLGDGEFNLPSIDSLGAAAQNCEIVIVSKGGGNNVTIDPALTEQVGSAPAGVAYVWAAPPAGASIVFSPVDANTWGYNVTA